MIAKAFEKRVAGFSGWLNENSLAKTLILLSPLNNMRLDAKFSMSPMAKLMILLCLVYFLSPLDVAPDFIPAIGYADDLFVAGLTFRAYSHYVDRYLESRINDPLDEERKYNGSETARPGGEKL